MLKIPCESTVSNVIVVPKAWGSESWVVNNELYCGKILYNECIWSSNGNYHYHPIKHETFFCIKGVLQVDLVIEEFNEFIEAPIIQTYHLNDPFDPNTPLTIEPGQRHRFKAVGDQPATFIEFSTKHNEDDSIRCYYDEITKKWIDIKI